MNFKTDYHIQLSRELEKYETWNQEEEKTKIEILNFLESNEIIIGTQNTEGHIVASAWIVNKGRDKVLLSHHRILDIWVQLGGHTDEWETAYDAALREGNEESGLGSIQNISSNIFDLDVHYFPDTKKRKAHYHYDIRYIFEADEDEKIVVSNESKDVKWIPFNELSSYTQEKELYRMMEKVKLLK